MSPQKYPRATVIDGHLVLIDPVPVRGDEMLTWMRIFLFVTPKDLKAHERALIGIKQAIDEWAKVSRTSTPARFECCAHCSKKDDEPMHDTPCSICQRGGHRL